METVLMLDTTRTAKKRQTKTRTKTGQSSVLVYPLYRRDSANQQRTSSDSSRPPSPGLNSLLFTVPSRTDVRYTQASRQRSPVNVACP